MSTIINPELAHSFSQCHLTCPKAKKKAKRTEKDLWFSPLPRSLEKRHQFFGARASLHHRHFGLFGHLDPTIGAERIILICVTRSHGWVQQCVMVMIALNLLILLRSLISSLFVDNYRLPTVASVLALLCLLTIANASSIAPSSITSNLCDFEDLPETLPSNLSSIAYLGLNGEFHIHGEFFANYSTHEHNTFFSLPTESYFRISVAPQQDWDVDLFLYSSEQSSPIASAVAFYGEEMITRVLPAGDYRLRFNFLSTISHRFIVIHDRLVLLLPFVVTWLTCCLPSSLLVHDREHWQKVQDADAGVVHRAQGALATYPPWSPVDGC
jgi:hypothetical protein